jgi:hypothetical protein
MSKIIEKKYEDTYLKRKRTNKYNNQDITIDY